MALSHQKSQDNKTLLHLQENNSRMNHPRRDERPTVPRHSAAAVAEKEKAQSPRDSSPRCTRRTEGTAVTTPPRQAHGATRGWAF